MKKSILFFGILFLFTAFTSFAQDSTTIVLGPALSLDKMEHDYGTIDQHENGDCVFLITNTGSEPLIISNCKGSCGCTVPSWPEKPIAPGETAELKVHYNTAKVGPINKKVTVSSNAKNLTKGTVVVRIKGNIKPPVVK